MLSHVLLSLLAGAGDAHEISQALCLVTATFSSACQRIATSAG